MIGVYASALCVVSVVIFTDLTRHRKPSKGHLVRLSILYSLTSSLVQDLENGSFKELYKHIYMTSGCNGNVLRFRAISTDGGVDMSARFWVCIKSLFDAEYLCLQCTVRAHIPTRG